VKIIQYLIYACFLLILIGGSGTVVGLVVHAESARLPFMYLLVGGLALFALTLLYALIAGTYLYFFTDRQRLGYFRRRGED
jgi:hypothetical protein